MRCPPVQKLQQLVLTGEADGIEELERHLTDCENCRNLLDKLQESAPRQRQLVFQDSHSSDAVDALVGSTVGKYTILERVATGSGATVYKGIQCNTDRPVAIKLLNGIRFSDNGLQAWRREARLAGRIDSPYVVRILDADRVDGYEYCVFEWISGGTLADRLKNSQLDFREAAQFTREVAKGCAALHAKGIIHRDIKPSNVLIADGHAKLADFGVARSVDETITTATGVMVGTPGYMSPEQLGIIKAEIDETTDVYGIGALLYALLIGRSPFVGSNAVEIVANASKHEFVPPSTERRLPKDLETICLKCLEKSPEDRYPNVIELEQDLERFMNREPILAKPPSALTTIRRYLAKHPRLASAIVTTLVLIACVFATWQWAEAKARHRIAGVKLEQLLEADGVVLPAKIESFAELHPRVRNAAIANWRSDHSQTSISHRLRLMLASEASQDELVEFAFRNLETLAVPDLTSLCQHLAVTSSDAGGSTLPQEIREELATKQTENARLGLLALLANVAPDEISRPESTSIVDLLNGNGSLHAEYWGVCFQPISLQLVESIGEQVIAANDSLNVDLLANYVWQWNEKGANSVEPKLLASLMVRCSIEQAVAFCSRLKESLRAAVAHELYNIWIAHDHLDIAASRRENSRTQPVELKHLIEQYHGVYSSGILMLPFVPLEDWQQVSETEAVRDFEVLEFRPQKIAQRVYVAVTLKSASERRNEVSIDIPEVEIAELWQSQRARGFHPVSIWARPSTDSNWERLLVSIVWSRDAVPTSIRFDESMQDWGIDPLKITRDNYWQANHFFALSLGIEENVEETRRVAKQAGFENYLEVHPVVEPARTVALVRERDFWDLPTEAVEPFRLQRIADTSFPEGALKVEERNFKFIDRPRKLTVEALPPSKYQQHCDYLERLGFVPESCSIDEDAAGNLLVSSRWSCPYFQNSRVADEQVAKAALCSHLLGDPRAIRASFDFKLDPTIPSWMTSYGAALESRHLPALAELLDSQLSDRQLYHLILLANYLPTKARNAALTEKIVAIAATSRNAGIKHAAAKYFEKEGDSPSLLRQITSPNTIDELQSVNPADLFARAKEASDGEVIELLPGYPMVVVDLRHSPSFVGAERLLLWDSTALQQSWILQHKFAIGVMPITVAQFRDYLQQTEQEDYERPATVASDEDPVVKVAYHQMLRYCLWCSQQCGLPSQALGLPPKDQITPNMPLDDNLVFSLGFRLPSFVEWQLASRAGSVTDRFVGNADPLLLNYANIANPGQLNLLPVGRGLPNPYGLFECYGNALEMGLHPCHGRVKRTIPERERQIVGPVYVTGGSFLTHGMYASAGACLSVTEELSSDQQIGFRLAITLDWDESD